MQLYVDKKREKSEALIRKIEDLGRLKAIFVTVDAAAPGKREADERGKAEIEVVSPGVGLRFNAEELFRDRLTHLRWCLALVCLAGLGDLGRQDPIRQ
jgi:isopentenyl diphosphate isomerase/L-lactate dehydrogenase-like FMN-dependent dehydrogenase